MMGHKWLLSQGNKMNESSLKLSLLGHQQSLHSSSKWIPPPNLQRHPASHVNMFICWWHGIAGNAFWMKRSYSTPGPVSTAMVDCLWAGKPSQC